MARFQVACSARFNDLESSWIQAHGDHFGTPSLADEDRKRFLHQEEPGSFDCPALLIHGARPVDYPHPILGPTGSP